MWLVATCLIVFGLVLWAADRRGATTGEAMGRGMADLSFGNAVVLGVAQGLAFQPGVSRSGVTLTVARSLRVERTEAARLVFLMSLPVIAGAGLLSAMDVTVPAGWWPPFLVGMVAAAVSGWFAVHGLLRLLARIRTWRVCDLSRGSWASGSWPCWPPASASRLATVWRPASGTNAGIRSSQWRVPAT